MPIQAAFHAYTCMIILPEKREGRAKGIVPPTPTPPPSPPIPPPQEDRHSLLGPKISFPFLPSFLLFALYKLDLPLYFHFVPPSESLLKKGWFLGLKTAAAAASFYFFTYQPISKGKIFFEKLKINRERDPTSLPLQFLFLFFVYFCFTNRGFSYIFLVKFIVILVLIFLNKLENLLQLPFLCFSNNACAFFFLSITKNMFFFLLLHLGNWDFQLIFYNL